MTFLRPYVLAIGLTTLAACQQPPAPPVRADQVDIDVRVLPNGSAEILERITATSSDFSRDGFERIVSYDTADTIRFVSASLDGRALSSDAPEGLRVEKTDRPSLRVHWTVPPDAATSHEFTLRYDVTSAIGVEGARGSLRLPVVPGNWSIGRARISLTLPDTGVLFDGSGLAEAGWQVERRGNGITAERGGVSPSETGTLVAEISVDPMSVAEPRWQVDERWGRILMPAFVSGGLFILITGAGILWIIRFQYPSRGAGELEDQEERLVVRRGLLNGGLVTMAVAIATAVLVWFTLGRLGPWPMALPAGILLVGLLFAVVSRRWV